MTGRGNLASLVVELHKTLRVTMRIFNSCRPVVEIITSRNFLTTWDIQV